ncbi:MAG: hypothetical protein ACRD12_12160 [Acidimicrobiales bacterium]
MGSLPEWWTGPYPEVKSLETATAYLDELGADLTRREDGGKWTLATGGQDLVTAEDEVELDGFVLGFALAHLIVERHGLIGRRMPHPAEQQASVPPADGESASAADDTDDAGDDTAGDDAGDEGEGSSTSEADESDGEDGP